MQAYSTHGSVSVTMNTARMDRNQIVIVTRNALVTLMKTVVDPGETLCTVLGLQ